MSKFVPGPLFYASPLVGAEQARITQPSVSLAAAQLYQDREPSENRVADH